MAPAADKRRKSRSSRPAPVSLYGGNALGADSQDCSTYRPTSVQPTRSSSRRVECLKGHGGGMGKLVTAYCGGCKRNIPIREMGAKTKCPTCRQKAQLAQKA